MSLRKLNNELISVRVDIQRQRGIINATQRQLRRRAGKSVSHQHDEKWDAEYLETYAGLSPNEDRESLILVQKYCRKMIRQKRIEADEIERKIRLEEAIHPFGLFLVLRRKMKSQHKGSRPRRKPKESGCVAWITTILFGMAALQLLESCGFSIRA